MDTAEPKGEKLVDDQGCFPSSQRANLDSGKIKLEDASSSLANDEDKRQLDHFLTKFEETFGPADGKPDYVIWAPGRVNIIGEHIDYHGFSVLPIAIKQRIWMGLSIRRKIVNEVDRQKITLANTCAKNNWPTWIGDHSLRYASSLASKHDWHNYFLCGYQGVLAKELLDITSEELVNDQFLEINDNNRVKIEMLQNLDSNLEKLPSLNILVHSDLPPASGLSSSSALVCASAIATMLAVKHNDILINKDSLNLERSQFAQNCSKFEHLIGTQGGGMDQAIIMTAELNFAKMVQFEPEFSCANVKLPESVVWIVSHCGVDCHKASTTGFNTRVLETKIGAALIALHHNIKTGLNVADPFQLNLGKLHQLIFKDWSSQDIIGHLRNQVFVNHPKQITIDECCQKFGMTREQFIIKFKVNHDIIDNLHNEELCVLPRCEHVFEEAERVAKFVSTCYTTSDTAILGQLMTQSHTSLRDKFQCSHPALDRLVDAALKAGALGSRLTGAGWGGCVISMVESTKSQTVLESLKDTSSFSFMTKPESGCKIIKVDY